MAAKAKTPAKKKAPSKKTAAKKPAAKKDDAATATAKPKAKSKAKSTPKAKAKSTPKAKAKASAKSKAAPKSKAKAPASKKPAARKPVDSQFRNFTPYEPKKNELYMSDEQLAHFRTMLVNWRTELMEEVDRTVHHMQDEAANFPDPADRATQEEEFSIELRTRDRERKLIKKIDQTIERLDQDDYGYCDTCGIEIGLRRLEARPTATQCVDCKALDEIKERQIHG